MTEYIQAPDGDRYQLIEPISRGAVGAVSRARSDDREVAVKRLTDLGQTALPDRGAPAVGLRHPRVVRVIDHFRDLGNFYP